MSKPTADSPNKIAPDLERMLDSIRKKSEARALEEEARAQAQAIREAITPGGQLPLEQTWFEFAPVPTPMARVSPFFPLNQRQLKDRPFVEDMVITQTSWGKITYTGPKLSTYEEDVLLALLALLDSSRHREETVSNDGRPTYMYRGHLLPLLKLLGIKNPGKTNYTRLLKALTRMTVAGVRLEIKDKSWVMSSILAGAKWNEKTQELTVTVNPFFYEMYMAGTVTLLDVIKRGRLRSPITKSMYRFIMSHRGKWSGHFLTLARALNLDHENQPDKQLRRQLKTAITELTKHGHLEQDSGFISKDIIKLIRPTELKRKNLPSP